MALLLLLSSLVVAPLRFAWLSDLHVGSPTGLTDLTDAVSDINDQGGIAFVLITGDVTERGSDAELLEVQSALAGLRAPFAIIPGNHDTKWSESGGTSFPRLFGGERFSFRTEGFTFLGLHQGPRMRMAEGHFAPEDLRWLDTALTRADPELPLFVASHYPLDSSIANWYEVLDRLSGRDVRMVFVGHGHRNRVLDFEGLPGLMGRSVLRGTDAKGGYNVVTVQGDSIVVQERRTGQGTSSPWFAARLGGRTMQGKGPFPRPSYAVNAGYPAIRERWRVATGYTVTASAAINDSIAVVADGGGWITALRLKDGEKAWARSTGGPVYGTPAMAQGRVVVGSADSLIWCFDAASGETLWRTPTRAPLVAAPAFDDGRVFIGSSDGSFRSLDLESGRVLWSFDSVGGFVETRPAIDRDAVYFGAWDNSFTSLNKHNGSLRWKWQRDPGQVLLSPAACWPVLAGGHVFFVAPDRVMTVLDAATGDSVWRSPCHQVRESIGESGDGSAVYVRTIRDSLIAFATAPDHPEMLWGSDAAFGYDINAAMPVESGGTLFYGTMKGVVLALNAGTGTVLWRHRIGPCAVNTLCPAGSSMMLCTDVDGTVVLLDASGGAP